MSRSLRAPVEEVLVIGITDEESRDACRRNPHDRRTRAQRRRRCDASVACAVPLAMDAPRGAVSLGFRPVCHDVTGHGFLERESNPQMLKPQFSAKPFGVPKHRRTGIEPVVASASNIQLPPDHRAFVIGKHRLAPRAYATAEPRAPGGRRRPRRWKRSSDASHCRRSRIGNSCDRRTRRRSMCEIDAQDVDQGWVPLRCAARVEAPQRTRMRLAARPWPRCVDWHRVLQGEAEKWREAMQECLHGRERALSGQRICR